MSSSSPLSAETVSPEELTDRIIEVCQEAAQGNLELRILNSCSDQRLAKAARSVNSLLDSIDAYVRESTACLTFASEGKLYRRVMERGMPGTFRQGSGTINRALHAMREQKDELANSQMERLRVIQSLSESLKASSDKINESLSAIVDVNRATRVLALNAKIESARAGVAGAGFSIVAQEVEATSQRINNAVQEIIASLKEVEEGTQAVLDEIRHETASVSGENE